MRLITKKLGVILILLAVTSSSLIIVFPVEAESRQIVVPDDYSTITAAINGASDGDNIFVKQGTYNETFTIDKALTLIGEDKETTIINGKNAGTVVQIRHDNVNFTGFTVIYDSTPNKPQPIWMWSTRLAGIHLSSVKGCNIYGNKVSDCGAGIWLYDAHQNNISNNTVFNNDYGIRVEVSTGNSISKNSATGNWGGIRLISTANNKLTENNINSNAQNLGISNEKIAFTPDEIDSSNRVDGKPVYYWVGASDRAIPPDAGYVVLVNCTKITIQGLSLSKNQEGIILAGTMNSTVNGNHITETTTGIILYNSFLDKITGNTIDAYSGISANGTGTQITGNKVTAKNIGISTGGEYQTVVGNTIRISEWQGNMVKISSTFTNVTKNTLIGTSYAYAVVDGPENIFYKNTITDSYGLRVTSDKNIIANNMVTGGSISVSGSNNTVCINQLTNGFGMTIAGHYNRYYANQIQGNTIGASLGGTEAYSSNNIIYQNNFIQNTQQIENYENKANFWDNGNTGNYWSDYNGTDENGDGIGDQPYAIMGQRLDQTLRTLVPIVTGQDNYPLMTPFNLDTITIQLPEWTPNFTLHTPITTPSPSPSASSSPTPSQSPTPSSSPSATPASTSSTIESPSASPSSQSTSSPYQPQALLAENIYLITAGIAVFAAIIIIAVIIKKRE